LLRTASPCCAGSVWTAHSQCPVPVLELSSGDEILKISERSVCIDTGFVPKDNLVSMIIT
jgi:hypothetical protein